MDTSQVFAEIISKFKWYAPKSEQWAYSFKRRFKKGQVKQSTLIEFFGKFGYIHEDIKWIKPEQIEKPSA